MGIAKEKLEAFKKAIDNAKKILVFFDDDCDGLAAFLQVYKYKGEAVGVAIRAVPELRADYIRKIKEHHPDLILVFDMAMISKEFLEENKVSLIWVDHHEPQAAPGITYLNPHGEQAGDNRPTSYWVHTALQASGWLATLGCVADWFWPNFAKDFQKEYPDLLPLSIQSAPEALFNSKLGVLVQVFLFNLKGTVREMNQAIHALAKVNSPREILDRSSEEGVWLFDRYQKYRKEYERILGGIPIPEEDFVVHIYENAGNAYSSELSNELMYRYPDKVFLVGRRMQDEVRCSLRATKKNVLKPLQEALKDVEGYGGGHANACGVCVKEKDFSVFVKGLQKALSI